MADLVTIHAGSPWEVELLRGRLEGEGILAFVPDANLHRTTPFLTGAGALHVRLQVRPEDVERATVLVGEYQAAVRPEGDAADEDEAESVEDRRARLTKLGRRIQWCSFLWVPAPIAVAMGMYYLLDLRPKEERPSNHRLTLAAILLAVLGTAAWFVLVRAIVEDAGHPRAPRPALP